MSAPTVESLQRELLAVLRGGTHLQTWARINGYVGSCGIDTRGEIRKAARALTLRLQIHALDPNAALYFGWSSNHERERFHEAQAEAARSAS
ncbi:hypothetical protein WDZ92_34285 [Nostoc sp. NIES-2111]